MSRDPRLQGFVELFNAGRYWDAHEALEPLWLETPEPRRELYRGLIQAAAAMVHHERGNRHGVFTLHAKARAKLLGFGPVEDGLDIRAFLYEVERCLFWHGPAPRLGLARWWAAPGKAADPAADEPLAASRQPERRRTRRRDRALDPSERPMTPLPAGEEASQALDLLIESFRLGGYVRWQSPVRAERDGPRYRKGHEVRFVADDEAGLATLRAALDTLGLHYGKSFAKADRRVLPVYGVVATYTLVAAFKAAGAHVPPEPSDDALPPRRVV